MIILQILTTNRPGMCHLTRWQVNSSWNAKGSFQPLKATRENLNLKIFLGGESMPPHLEEVKKCALHTGPSAPNIVLLPQWETVVYNYALKINSVFTVLVQHSIITVFGIKQKSNAWPFGGIHIRAALHGKDKDFLAQFWAQTLIELSPGQRRST